MDTSKKMGGALGAKRGSTKREEGVPNLHDARSTGRTSAFYAEAIIAIGAKAAKRLLKRVVETRATAGWPRRTARAAHARRRLLPSIERRDDAGGCQTAVKADSKRKKREREERKQRESARGGGGGGGGEKRGRRDGRARALTGACNRWRRDSLRHRPPAPVGRISRATAAAGTVRSTMASTASRAAARLVGVRHAHLGVVAVVVAVHHPQRQRSPARCP